MNEIQRWTGAPMKASDAGGFVAYGDYLELKRESDLLRAALAAQSVPAEVEPVAWQFRHEDEEYGWGAWNNDFDRRHIQRMIDNGLKYEIRELFTHPPAQADSTPGWKLVPIEPTKEMIAAPMKGKVEVQDVANQLRIRVNIMEDYRAMIAAAPQPPKGTP